MAYVDIEEAVVAFKDKAVAEVAVAVEALLLPEFLTEYLLDSVVVVVVILEELAIFVLVPRDWPAVEVVVVVVCMIKA